MGRGLQTFSSPGWVGLAGARTGRREKRKRSEPCRLVEPARRAASGSQVTVGTAAASRPAKAVLSSPPFTLSDSLLLLRGTSPGSPRRIPSLYPVTARRRAPARGAPGASRTPSPLRPLSALRSPLCCSRCSATSALANSSSGRRHPAAASARSRRSRTKVGRYSGPSAREGAESDKTGGIL